MSNQDTSGAAYWAANVKLITLCLVIWAVVSYGFGILLRPVLDAMVPLGDGFGLGRGACSEEQLVVLAARKRERERVQTKRA